MIRNPYDLSQYASCLKQQYPVVTPKNLMETHVQPFQPQLSSVGPYVWIKKLCHITLVDPFTPTTNTGFARFYSSVRMW